MGHYGQDEGQVSKKECDMQVEGGEDRGDGGWTVQWRDKGLCQDHVLNRSEWRREPVPRRTLKKQKKKTDALQVLLILTPPLTLSLPRPILVRIIELSISKETLKNFYCLLHSFNRNNNILQLDSIFVFDDCKFVTCIIRTG